MESVHEFWGVLSTRPTLPIKSSSSSVVFPAKIQESCQEMLCGSYAYFYDDDMSCTVKFVKKIVILDLLEENVIGDSLNVFVQSAFLVTMGRYYIKIRKTLPIWSNLSIQPQSQLFAEPSPAYFQEYFKNSIVPSSFILSCKNNKFQILSLEDEVEQDQDETTFEVLPDKTKSRFSVHCACEIKTDLECSWGVVSPYTSITFVPKQTSISPEYLEYWKNDSRAQALFVLFQEFLEGNLRHPLLLLTAPSNSGKTALLQACAQTHNLPLRVLTGGQTVVHFSLYFENFIRQAYRSTPCVVVIDNVDLLLGKQNVDPVILSILKEYAKGVYAPVPHLGCPVPSSSVLVIATASSAKDIHPSFLTLVDDIVELGPPTLPQIQQVLATELHRHHVVDIDRGVVVPSPSPLELEKMARMLQGYHVGSLVQIANHIRFEAGQRFEKDLPASSSILALLRTALRCVPLTATGSDDITLFSTTPLPFHLSDVVGLDREKAILRERILACVSHENETVKRSFGVVVPRGAFLTGPYGVGKTMLAHAMCRALELRTFVLRLTDVVRSYVGESEQVVLQLVEHAKRTAPCVILLDDAHALTATGTAGPGEADRSNFVSQLLSELSAAESYPIFLLLTSSDPSQVHPSLRDPVLVGDPIELSLPDVEAKKELFQRRGWTLPESAFAEILPFTNDLSCADINSIMQTVYAERVRGEQMLPLTTSMIQQAIQEQNRSYTL